MKTKRRLSIILFSCILSFIVSAFVIERVVTNRVEILLEEKLKSVSNQVDKTIFIQAAPIIGYVEESSYWDELCTALKNNDTAWITSNMTTPLQTPFYKANLITILDNTGKNIYNKIFNTPNQVAIKNIEPSLDLTKYGKTSNTERICFKKGDHYFEGYISSIVPRIDYARKTKPLGFLIVCKIINQDYLKGLEELNPEYKYSFETASVKPQNFINKKTAVITFYKTISCINAPPLYIRVTNINSETKAYIDFVRESLLLFLIFISVIIIILYRYFFRYFFKPLEKISIALEKNDSTIISNVITKDTELGKVAKMIDIFFEQNKNFQTEIDHRIQTEAELKWAVDKIETAMLAKLRAEQSADAKSEFLATMSHEIRTPINGVIGVANLLKDEKLTPRQKEYVDILNYSSKHLLALVSDILDFSKIETGKVEFESTSFNLNNICESVYQVFKINANVKGIDLIYNPDKTIENSVYGDGVRINQVLTNLVGNAIKFTEKGRVTFGYKLLSKTVNNCTVEFTVQDTGIGIATNEQENIFDGFAQANKKIASNFGGTGLGLTISKKLIELQGGRLTMKSELGKGSTFTFYITFETHAYEKTLPNVNSTAFISGSNLNGMQVLIVEDNNINVLVLKRFLEKWGIHYKVANNGKTAVEMVGRESFDLVLMDIHMPIMDGEEATREIRLNANERISKIPIIALTANATVDMQHKLLNNGFTNYLSKPFNPDNLFKVLKKHYVLV